MIFRTKILKTGDMTKSIIRTADSSDPMSWKSICIGSIFTTELTNKGESMKKRIILLMLISLSAVTSFAKQRCILYMKGGTSIFAVMDVFADMNDNALILIDAKRNKAFLTLKKSGNVFSGNFNGYDGVYSLSVRKDKKTFAGNFFFVPNETGKKRFYLKDKGSCRLVPYDEKTFAKWNNEMNKYLYRMDCYKNIDEMSKHSPWARNYLAKRRKITNSENVPIKFYGMVVDQFDKPVENADVYLGIRFTPLIMWTNIDKNFHLKTDKNGRFYLSGRGNQVIIDKIFCDGYRTKKIFKISSFSYNSRHGNPYVPDPNHPVVFVISKITDKATYLLLNRDFDIALTSGSVKYFGFLELDDAWEDKYSDRYDAIIDKQYYKYMDELEKKKLTEDERDEKLEKYENKLRKKYSYEELFLKKHYDFKVFAKFDKKKSDWIVTFTASGNDGGFILGDEFLSEAPEKGYRKEFKFVQHVLTEKEKNLLSETEDRKVEEKYIKLRDFVLKNKYLYIKSRTPAIYTRMKLEDSTIGIKKFNIDASTATNPYGERNLEAINDDLPLDVSDECSNIDKYFLEGKLPPKPNIKKMMAEFKKTHKRVRNKETGEYRWISK